jgi:hypothetical protein
LIAADAGRIAGFAVAVTASSDPDNATHLKRSAASPSRFEVRLLGPRSAGRTKMYTAPALAALLV